MKSYKRRRAAARLTRSISDSLFERHPNAALIVMGDLNDDPVDKSVLSDLGSTDKIDQASNLSLFNPMIRMYKARNPGLARWMELIRSDPGL